MNWFENSKCGSGSRDGGHRELAHQKKTIYNCFVLPEKPVKINKIHVFVTERTLAAIFSKNDIYVYK